jgi:hypothetical protein
MTSTYRILTGVALLGGFLFFPACGDDDRRSLTDGAIDGALDGSPDTDAAGFDAGLPDAGMSDCVGRPMGCASLDVATCGTVIGCKVTRCVGYALTCGMRSRDECMAGTGTGCSWDGAACVGTALSCADVTDEAVCVVNTGCSQRATDVCRGEAQACETFTRETCTTQPGCGPYTPPFDAGPPVPDAGCGTFDGGTGAVDVSVRVVLGPGPIVPASGAHVRVESPCGGFQESDTAADGTVTFSLPRAGGQWDLTAALAGYAAVSVLDVTNFTLTGDLRLDPVAPRDEPTYAVSGTLGGSIGIGNSVQIDAYNFNTISAATSSWSSTFSASPLGNRQPLRFVALELDSAGFAVNAATTEVPRVAADVTGVALTLPSPRVAPVTSTFNVRLPSSGMVTTAGMSLVGAFAERVSTLDEGQYVYSGTAQVALVGGNVQVTVQHFPGADTGTNFAGATGDNGSSRLNVYRSNPADPSDIVVGSGTVVMYGGALSDLEVAVSGASGHDTVAIHLAESNTENPRWRVYAPTFPATVRVPHLPSAVSLTDLGIVADSYIGCIVMLLKMESGAAWSTRASNGGVAGYQYTVGGSYQYFSATGR